jgi:hypothetical protein
VPLAIFYIKNSSRITVELEKKEIEKKRFYSCTSDYRF